MPRSQSSVLRGLLFRLAALGLGLVLTVALDRTVGLFISTTPEVGLISRPYERVRFDTLEFDVVVTANNIGIRDRDVTPKLPETYRIVALGDSFTFGWGVELEETWVKLLEQDLRNRLLTSVEVVNLGNPGAFSIQYADLLERAMTVLEPDLVIVAMLQGDDVEQRIDRSPARPAGWFDRCRSASQTFKSLTTRLWPNVRMLAERPASTDGVTLRHGWKVQAERLLCQSDEPDKERVRAPASPAERGVSPGQVQPPLHGLGGEQAGLFPPCAGLE